MDEKSTFEQQMKLLQTVIEQQQVYIQAVREEIRITPAKVERIRLMQEVAICPECVKRAQVLPCAGR